MTTPSRQGMIESQPKPKGSWFKSGGGDSPGGNSWYFFLSTGHWTDVPKLFKSKKQFSVMRVKKPKKGFDKLTEGKARLIAHSIGDGYVGISKHDYNIKYEVSDKELLDSFETDLVNTYGLKAMHGKNPSGKTGKDIPYIRLRSKLVFEDLMKYATYYSKDWRLKPLFLNCSSEIKREFLKALFDDEGSVIPGNKTIRLYSINERGLLQVKDMLTEFKITSRIKSGFGYMRNVYALAIKDLKLFKERIGFNLQRKQEKLNNLLK